MRASQQHCDMKWRLARAGTRPFEMLTAGVAALGGVGLIVTIVLLWIGVSNFEIKGVILSGNWLVGFISLLLVGSLVLFAISFGLSKRRPWGRPVASCFFPAVAAIAFLIDVATPGPRDPLSGYLAWATVPACVVYVLLYVIPSAMEAIRAYRRA